MQDDDRNESQGLLDSSPEVSPETPPETQPFEKSDPTGEEAPEAEPELVDLGGPAVTEDKRELPLTKDLSDAEWAYPHDYEEDGEVYELIFFMESYAAYDMKQLLSLVQLNYEPHDQRRIGMSSEGSEVYGPFFDKHFVRIEGLLNPGTQDSVSVEDQIAWINENDPQRAIKRGVVRGGIGNVNSIIGGEKKRGLVVRLGRSGSIIKTWRVLYNEETQKADKLFVDHQLDKESDKDRRQYDAATGKSEIIRRQQSAFMRSDQNFDSYEQIYDRLIFQVDGYLIKGKACRRDNKNDWIRLIPFWEKQFVVDEHFRAVGSKNV